MPLDAVVPNVKALQKVRCPAFFLATSRWLGKYYVYYHQVFKYRLVVHVFNDFILSSFNVHSPGFNQYVTFLKIFTL